MNKSLLLYFSSLYKKKFRQNYPIVWGKHGKLIQRLKENYTDLEIRKFLWYHVNDPNDFVLKTGCSLESLPSQVTRYIQLLNAVQSTNSNDYDRLANFRKTEDEPYFE